MWSIVKKEDISEFLRDNPYLANYDDEYILWEDDNIYILPRYFYQSFPHNKIFLHKDKKFEPQPIDIQFTGELRDEQEDLGHKVNEILKFENTLHGVVKARPGFGKTVISVYISSIFKYKTLVLLDNNKLVEQWVDAFKEFSNLDEDDIGFIQSSKLETDKPVAIGMVQTFLSKTKNNLKDFYSSIREAGYGVVFYDEVHKTGSAPKFAKSSLLLNTPNVIGLSATPYANDINQVLMDNTIGDIFFESSQYEHKPEYYFLKFNSGLGKKYYPKLKYMGDYIKQQAFYNSIITKSEEYLHNIYKRAEELVNDGHRLIVIASTVKQVDTICEYLEERGLEPTPFHASNDDLDKSQDNLLVATLKYSGAGFDYKELSALMLACPIKGKNSVIQTVGRILRSCEGKNTPIVYDMIDTSFGDVFLSSIPKKENLLKAEFGDDLEVNVIETMPQFKNINGEDDDTSS